jgi:hypothetical protein
LFLCVLALALALAAVPPPVLAEDPSPPAAKSALQASVQKITATITLAQSQSPSGGSQADREKLASSSFFKTKVGIAVIAAMAVGTGYALYSAKHDRILSPAR